MFVSSYFSRALTVLLVAFASLALAGCPSSHKTEMRIMVRTDLTPFREFRKLKFSVDLDGAEFIAPEFAYVSADDAWRTGMQIADIGEHVKENSSVVVHATMLDETGAEIMTRTLRFTYDGLITSATLVMTRSCLGMACGDGQTCHAGACVADTCLPDVAGSCGAAQCSSSSECAPAEHQCGQADCQLGVCFQVAKPYEVCSVDSTCCARGYWCQPNDGCQMIPVPPDMGPTDGGTDAPTDAMMDMQITDARMDAPPTDARMDMPRDMGPDLLVCLEHVGESCQPPRLEDACRTGQIVCPSGECMPMSTKPAGTDCGFLGERVCNPSAQCVDCENGAACIIARSCQYGHRVRANGCTCEADSSGDFLDEGELCYSSGNDIRYCDGSGTCRRCGDDTHVPGQNCGTSAECFISRYQCITSESAVTLSCVPETSNHQPNGRLCEYTVGQTGLCQDGNCQTCSVGDNCLAASEGNAACVYGSTACDISGGISCNPLASPSGDDFLAGGSACGVGRVCDGAGTCFACVQGEACDTAKKCAVSERDCTTGASVCEQTSLALSGARGVSESNQCGSTETCNGFDANCQDVLSNVVDVAVGSNHVCAVTADDAAALSRGETYVVCWGENRVGALGLGGGVELQSCSRGHPVRVPFTGTSASGIKTIAVGYALSCAIDLDGKVYCWGNNIDGDVGGLPGTTDAAGGTFSDCSGSGSSRVCAELSPRQVRFADTTLRFKQIAISQTAPRDCTGPSSGCTYADHYKVCAVTEDGKVYCWGPAPTNITSALVPTGFKAKQVALGEGHWCVLSQNAAGTESRVYCGGAFSQGQRGDEVTDHGASFATFPVASLSNTLPVPGMSHATSIAAAGQITCATTSAAAGAGTGHVACWGYRGGFSVDPGIDTSPNGDNVFTPVYVRTGGSGTLPFVTTVTNPASPGGGNTLLDRISDIAAGAGAVCARQTTGTLYCWGTSMIGNGTEGGSRLAVQQATQPTRQVLANARVVPGFGASLAVGFGRAGSASMGSGGATGSIGCFIRDGDRRQLFCWGANGARQLGNCTNPSRTGPVPVLAYDADVTGGSCPAISYTCPVL